MLLTDDDPSQSFETDLSFIHFSKPTSKRINLTSMLVRAYKSTGQHERSAEVQEERGLLLEGAKQLKNMADSEPDKSRQSRLTIKSVELETRSVDLVLRCDRWKEQEN